MVPKGNHANTPSRNACLDLSVCGNVERFPGDRKRVWKLELAFELGWSGKAGSAIMVPVYSYGWTNHV